MTKQELAQKVASDTGLSGSDAKGAVDATFDAIAAELAKVARSRSQASASSA